MIIISQIFTESNDCTQIRSIDIFIFELHGTYEKLVHSHGIVIFEIITMHLTSHIVARCRRSL